MAPILKFKRFQLLAGAGRNYLRYALGEIILVTLGILIALYIKNWYGEIRQQQQIDRAAQLVVDDLRKDTARINEIMESYMPDRALHQKLISGSLSRQSIDTCQACPYLITTIASFKPSESGYLLLQKFEIGLKSPRDSLLHETRQFYGNSKNIIRMLQNMVKEDITSNLQDWRDHEEWYAVWMSGKRNAALNSYLASTAYRNKVANFYLLLFNNYLQGLRDYRKKATRLADDWERLIEDQR